ncbi:hypothetical protein LZG04_10060 [Saccharothrix sp. S26]|uniref:hypothetical protein n=1 Tax=Saccharothrix sp. S26 TaxID=2907215 RepID=UPI001F25F126|nr:hypothetical protein [Saccharothrix sp. S26]MCE6995151.1 hypothetical protein [Saccharothrix sp. S26]
MLRGAEITHIPSVNGLCVLALVTVALPAGATVDDACAGRGGGGVGEPARVTAACGAVTSG